MTFMVAQKRGPEGIHDQRLYLLFYEFVCIESYTSKCFFLTKNRPSRTLKTVLYRAYTDCVEYLAQ